MTFSFVWKKFFQGSQMHLRNNDNLIWAIAQMEMAMRDALPPVGHARVNS